MAMKVKNLKSWTTKNWLTPFLSVTEIPPPRLLSLLRTLFSQS